MLVCCGGGGLTAGCALAFAALSPQTSLFAVEPADYDDTRRSLEAGRPLPHGATTRSEEHTSELQSLMRSSYAVFCSKKNTAPTGAPPPPRWITSDPSHSPHPAQPAHTHA